MGLTEVEVKLVLGELVVEVEGDSDPGRCVARLPQSGTRGWRVCLLSGPLGGTSTGLTPPSRNSKVIPQPCCRLGIYPWIPVNPQNTLLHELGRIWKRKPILHRGKYRAVRMGDMSDSYVSRPLEP